MVPEVLYDLDQDDSYDPTNRLLALETVVQREELVTGLIYREEAPSYEELYPGFRDTPIVEQDWSVPEEAFNELLAEFR